MMALHLVEIRIDPKKAYQWGSALGLKSTDVGYLAHSLACAAYGDHAPRPFSLQPGGPTIRLLGYSKASDADLIAEREATSEPSVNACFISEISKKMPDEIGVDRLFSFELRAAATRRLSGKEFDAAWNQKDDRESAYKQWLVDRLGDAAAIQDVRIDGFAFTHCVRRSEKDDGKRRPMGMRVPDVMFKGTLKVSNADLFARRLENGVGRHKAFGFGALLLRPARS